jgi:hypothetical protein
MNTGFFSLGDFPVSANAAVEGDWVTDLGGADAITCQLRFDRGGGGGTVKAYLQTTLDQGATVIDIACIRFDTASEVEVFTVTGIKALTTPIAPTDATLADDTVIDGVLGDRVRLKFVSTGPAYSGSTLLGGRIAVR